MGKKSELELTLFEWVLRKTIYYDIHEMRPFGWETNEK